MAIDFRSFTVGILIGTQLGEKWPFTRQSIDAHLKKNYNIKLTNAEWKNIIDYAAYQEKVQKEKDAE